MKPKKTNFKRDNGIAKNRGVTSSVSEKTTVAFESVLRKGGVVVSYTIPSTAAATAGNYGIFFIAPRAMTIMEVLESHQVASTSGTLNLEILASGVASGSGDDVLVTPFSLSATADTPQMMSGTDLTETRTLVEGERLGLVVGGTLTNQVSVTVTVYLIYSNRGDFF